MTPAVALLEVRAEIDQEAQANDAHALITRAERGTAALARKAGEALAKTGASPAVTSAVKAREARTVRIESDLRVGVHNASQLEPDRSLAKSTGFGQRERLGYNGARGPQWPKKP